MRARERDASAQQAAAKAKDEIGTCDAALKDAVSALSAAKVAAVLTTDEKKKLERRAERLRVKAERLAGSYREIVGRQ